MSNHSRVYSAYQLDIGVGGFKRDFITHRNEVITAVKRTSTTRECDGREKRRDVEGSLGEKRDVVPPQQLLPKRRN